MLRARVCARACTQWCTYAYLVYTQADAQITSVLRWREVERLGEHRSVRKSLCFTSVYTSSRAMRRKEGENKRDFAYLTYARNVLRRIRRSRPSFSFLSEKYYPTVELQIE